jgi:hypothetical protein
MLWSTILFESVSDFRVPPAGIEPAAHGLEMLFGAFPLFPSISLILVIIGNMKFTFPLAALKFLEKVVL